MIEPRNVTDRGADAVNRAEGNIGCVVSGLGASGPPGSKSRACSQRGCRGTWEIPPSPRARVEGRGLRHRRSSEEEPVTATPRCLTTSSSAWYRRANARERGGTDDGKSEHSDSTCEAGELSPAGASGGKRSAGSRNRQKETQRDIVLEWFCVNAISTDNESGLRKQ